MNALELPASLEAGFCQCGCGGRTNLISETCRTRGLIKGQPFRFIAGHQRNYRPDLSDALPFKIDGVYCRLIPLTKGQFTIVDAADYEWLNQWTWCAQWNKCTHSYYAMRRTSIDGKWQGVRMNRLIIGLQGTEKGDHRNGVTLINTRKNLRKADASENAVNSRRRKDNLSGAKGVFWESSRGKWRVQVQFRGKEYHGGRFSDVALAAKAHGDLYNKIAGEFAREKAMQ